MEVRPGSIDATDVLARRSARARLLAKRYPAAADVLGFYAKLVEYQLSMLATTPRLADTGALVKMTGPFLDWLAGEAPPALAYSAVALRGLTEEDWRQHLSRAFSDAGETATADSIAAFVAEALVQPWAEREAMGWDPVGGEQRDGQARCPCCGCAPVAGMLREEGHGARRSLLCARCATEWRVERVACAACGEREFEALPVYTAEPFTHVRVDACDRCRVYLKTIDLTKDGLAIPQVDDLASLALDLWAREHGYVRLRSNLLRT